MSDDEKRHQVQTVSATITQTVESPYPPAEEIAGYERVLPGSAERIISLVEDESKHRRELETFALQQGSRDSLLGLIFAFVVAMTSTVGGGLLVYFDHPIAGSIFGMSGVASVVSAFLRSKKQSSRPPNDGLEN